ncbi:hypothetical protein THAOC_21926, partial [Thalassiosira oceanica]
MLPLPGHHERVRRIKAKLVGR